MASNESINETGDTNFIKKEDSMDIFEETEDYIPSFESDVDPLKLDDTPQETLTSEGRNSLHESPSSLGTSTHPQRYIERLIYAVRVSPCLWDRKSAKHNDRSYVAKRWEEIGAMLQIPADSAKRKFKNLRDQFRLELKRLPANRMVDPDVPVEEYRSTWPLFRDLFFLRDAMLVPKGRNSSLCNPIQNTHSPPVPSASQTSLNDTEQTVFPVKPIVYNIEPVAPQPINSTQNRLFLAVQSVPSSSDSRSQTPTIQPMPTCGSQTQSHTQPLKKKRKKAPIHQELLQIEKEKMQLFKKATEDENDPERCFLLSLLPLLRRLPPEKASEVKIQISQLLHEANYCAGSDMSMTSTLDSD